MNELIPVLKTLVAEVESGRPAALCAVVHASGSTPRAPGAAMLVRSDGTTIGTVGGGLVEVQTRDKARELLQQNQAARLDSDLDRDPDEGMICGGRMQIAVVPVTVVAQLAQFRQALDLAGRHEPAHLTLVVSHAGAQLEYRVHVEVPPTLVIAGAGHVGQALARLAGLLDFRVVVMDDRAAVADRARFDDRAELVIGDFAKTLGDFPLDPNCYVVIVTRGHQQDARALATVIRRPAAYIGMMASRKKAATVLKLLAESGVPQPLLDQVHTPIGLSVGAVTVPELAVSIMGELIQVRRRTTPKLVEGPCAPSA